MLGCTSRSSHVVLLMHHWLASGGFFLSCVLTVHYTHMEWIAVRLFHRECVGSISAAKRTGCCGFFFPFPFLSLPLSFKRQKRLCFLSVPPSRACSKCYSSLRCFFFFLLFYCLRVFRGRKGHRLCVQLLLLLSARQSNHSRIAPHLSFLFLCSPFLSSSSFPVRPSSSTTEGGWRICNNCAARASPNVCPRLKKEKHVFGAIQCELCVLFIGRDMVCRFRVRTKFTVFELIAAVAVLSQAAFCLWWLGGPLVLFFYCHHYLLFRKRCRRQHRCQAAIHFVRSDNECCVSVFLSGFFQACFMCLLCRVGLALQQSLFCCCCGCPSLNDIEQVLFFFSYLCSHGSFCRTLLRRLRST